LKAAAANWLAFVLSLTLGAAAFLLTEGRPGRAAAENLRVQTLVDNHGEWVELRVSWRWDLPVTDLAKGAREHLLAVSYDTRKMVLEAEEAPLGRGADGETLRRLEKEVGVDGARRHFVIPEGEDGAVALRFRGVREDVTLKGSSFAIYIAFARENSDVWTFYAQVPSKVSAPLQSLGRDDLLPW
jgi:hypothetical protein